MEAFEQNTPVVTPEERPINVMAYLEALNKGISPVNALKEGMHRARMIQAGFEIQEIQTRLRTEGSQNA
jgi:hypothetical protein